MKTKKNNKKIRKTHKIGGKKILFLRLGKWHKQYKAINLHNADCAASTMHALGYTDYRTSIYLGRLIRPTRTRWGGTSIEKMSQMLNIAYPDPTRRWEKVNNKQDILQRLHNNEATVLYVNWQRQPEQDYYSGHFVVVMASRNKRRRQAYIFDPQAEQGVTRGTFALEKWVNINTIYDSPDSFWHSIYILNSDLPANNDFNKVTIDIVNEVYNPDKREQKVCLDTVLLAEKELEKETIAIQHEFEQDELTGEPISEIINIVDNRPDIEKKDMTQARAIKNTLNGTILVLLTRSLQPLPINVIAQDVLEIDKIYNVVKDESNKIINGVSLVQIIE